jgi:tetratricopeptide (TPR) repeat protein
VFAGRAEVPVANTQSDKADALARDTPGARLAAKRAAKAARKAASRGNTNAIAEVTKSVLEANAWVDKHARVLWLGLGAVVVGIAAWIVVGRYMDARARAAGDLLHTAVTSSQGIVTTPDEPAPEDPVLPVFASTKERDEKALQQFAQVDKQYPDSKAALYARLNQGNDLLALNKPVEAAAAYDKLLASASDDTFLRAHALEGAGYALEAQKKYADAQKRFEELSKLSNGAYRTLGDYQRARQLVLQDQRDQARKVLEELSKANADKPGKPGEPNELNELNDQGERYESISFAAQTLLTELGGQPAEKSGGKNSGISQHVLDSLRKQLGSQKK